MTGAGPKGELVGSRTAEGRKAAMAGEKGTMGMGLCRPGGGALVRAPVAALVVAGLIVVGAEASAGVPVKAVPPQPLLSLVQSDGASADEPGPVSADELKAAIDDIRRRLEEQQEERGDPSAADELQIELRSARETIAELTANLARLRQERDELMAELDAARAENTALSGDLADRDEELAAVERQQAELVGALEGRVDELETRAAALDATRQEAAAAERRLESAQGEIAELTETLQQAWAERDSLDAELRSTRQRLAEAEDELETAEAARQALSRALEAARAEIAALDAERAKLAELARAGIDEVTGLGEQLLAAREEKQRLLSALAELRASKALLDGELEAARRDVDIYAAQARDLRRRLGDDATRPEPAAGPDAEAEAGTVEPFAVEALTAPDQLDASDETAASDGGEETVASAAEAPAAAIGATLSELNAVEAEDGWLMTVPDGIAFDPGSGQLAETAKPALDKVAALIRYYGAADVRIAGHTDSVGDPDLNRRLSLRRAESVRNYLIEAHGFDRERIATEGHGAERPIADNASASGRRANRRVEIYFRRDSEGG